MLRWFTKSTPVSEEHKILLAHEYDGIRELDNKIPPWFNFLFYGSIIFSIIYMINYHVIGSGNIQEEEYLEEVRAASLQREILTRSGSLLDENSVTFTDDAGSLANGKEIFIKSCAACHGQKGEGLVGPNLTDDYWIHGGGIKNIFKVIKDGVPQKGMISWQSQLSPNGIRDVGSYIMTLRGTDPPNGKQPEGDLYTPPDNGDKTDDANI
jgi:cytochrome c oxidase cbb3-type subunit 3